MKKKIPRHEAKEKIDNFFRQENFSPDELKKIKRLAMSYNIKIGNYKRQFCKNCLAKLRGKTRISKSPFRLSRTKVCSLPRIKVQGLSKTSTSKSSKIFRTIQCEKCGHLNRHSFRIKQAR